MFAIKNLSSSDLETIRKHLTERSVDKNEVLFEAGKNGSCMYFVETGTLKIVDRKSKDGLDDQIIALVKPGGFCGEEVILSEGGVYKDTVVAMEPGVVYEFSSSSLQKIMVESTLTGTKLVLGISKNYREAINISDQKGKLIAFVSAKDGAGKTTLCMNLAEAFARRNKKILVIDCDFQLGNCHMHLSSPANPNLARLVQMEERLTFDRISKFIISKSEINLLAAPELPQDAEMITRSQLNQILQECSRHYDFVFLDVSCHIDEFSILLWDVADQIVLLQKPCLDDLTRFKRLMTVIKRLNYPKEKFVGVINQYENSASEYLEQFKNIMNTAWLKVAADKENVAKALFNGQTIIAQASGSKAVIDIDNICQFLLSEKNAEVKEKTGMFTWLRDYFSGE